MACAIFVGRGGRPSRVLGDRHGEQCRVLERGRHGLAQCGQTTRDAWPSMRISPSAVVQPRQQRRKHRLARARRPDEGQRLAGFDRDVEPQRPIVGLRVGELEARVDQFEPAAASAALTVGDLPGASKISAIRLAAVKDSCVIDSRKPSDAIGQTSDSIMVMNATSVPMVT